MILRDKRCVIKNIKLLNAISSLMVDNQSESAQSSILPDEEQSPKLLPRVSISNIKSPSKRHSVASKALSESQCHVLDWLSEVKQFVSFINIHFYVSHHRLL